MSQQELLKRLVDFLDGAPVPYMLTGSIASSLQVQHGHLDQTYLQEWAKKLSVEDSLARIEREAKPS